MSHTCTLYIAYTHTHTLSLSHAGSGVPGHRANFSSYPGVLYSGDDFYQLSSKAIPLWTRPAIEKLLCWQSVHYSVQRNCVYEGKYGQGTTVTAWTFSVRCLRRSLRTTGSARGVNVQDCHKLSMLYLDVLLYIGCPQDDYVYPILVNLRHWRHPRTVFRPT